MPQPIRIKGRIRLKNFDPEYCGGLDKDETRLETQKLCQRIAELQQRLYASSKHSVVILLQGIDASGKDGTSKNVLEFVNPAGVETTNFKVPSREELAHDFLWRIHKAVPHYGNIGVFNRSHYEDVLIARVMKLVPEPVWKARYDQINAFEKLLFENHVILLKFFLHISKDEQAQRLQARLDDPAKNWKFETADLQVREHWKAYQEAYEDILSKCGTRHSPWHLIPANRKWYRDHVVARTVVDTLENLKLKWPKPTSDLKKIRIV